MFLKHKITYNYIKNVSMNNDDKSSLKDTVNLSGKQLGGIKPTIVEPLWKISHKNPYTVVIDLIKANNRVLRKAISKLYEVRRLQTLVDYIRLVK